MLNKNTNENFNERMMRSKTKTFNLEHSIKLIRNNNPSHLRIVLINISIKLQFNQTLTLEEETLWKSLSPGERNKILTGDPDYPYDATKYFVAVTPPPEQLPPEQEVLPQIPKIGRASCRERVYVLV